MTRTLLTCLLFCLCLPLQAADEIKEYRLQKDDVLRMMVYQEEELATETRVGKSGFVSFPLIGTVKVVGLTVKEAEDQVKAMYEKDYLVSAKVNLTILSYAKKWVVVGGDVRRPGTIEYPEEGALNLWAAIAQSGGLMETANDQSIILRHKDGGSSTHSLSAASGIILKHGDTVTVSRNTLSRSTVTVAGQVNRSGVVEFPKEGGLDLVTAIAQAGGFNRIANQKIVIVHRGGKRHSVNYRDITKGKASMFNLRAGDIVTVEESPW